MIRVTDRPLPWTIASANSATGAVVAAMALDVCCPAAQPGSSRANRSSSDTRRIRKRMLLSWGISYIILKISRLDNGFCPVLRESASCGGGQERV